MRSSQLTGFLLAGVAPVSPALKIAVSEEMAFDVRLPGMLKPAMVTTLVSPQGATLELFWDASGVWEGLATRGGFGVLPVDYDLPDKVDFGLPQTDRVTLPLGKTEVPLLGREIEPDVACGDIIVDWSSGLRADGVLISQIGNEVILCCHYHQSTKRWVGFSLRNIPITIMGESPRFGPIQPMSAGRSVDWRGFLGNYYPA